MQRSKCKKGPMLMECVWYGYFTNYLESVEELRKGLVPNRSEWDINLSQEKSRRLAQATHFLLKARFPLSIHYFDLGFFQFREMYDVFNLISYSL